MNELDLTIVVPVYNEEENLEALQAEIVAALDPIGIDYEVIYVDDGSKDRSADIVKQMGLVDPRGVLVSFRRN
ncbi:MAG: glycosyltransferase, partial [Chloroflexota bacterium]